MGGGGFLQGDLLAFLCSVHFLSFRVDWGTSDRILVPPACFLSTILPFTAQLPWDIYSLSLEPARPRCYAPYLQGSLPYGILGEDTVHFNAIQMSRFLFFITPLHLAAIHQRQSRTLKGMLCPLCPFNRTFGSKLQSVDHTCATDVWACVAKIKNKKSQQCAVGNVAWKTGTQKKSGTWTLVFVVGRLCFLLIFSSLERRNRYRFPLLFRSDYSWNTGKAT